MPLCSFHIFVYFWTSDSILISVTMTFFPKVSAFLYICSTDSFYNQLDQYFSYPLSCQILLDFLSELHKIYYNLIWGEFYYFSLCSLPFWENKIWPRFIQIILYSFRKVTIQKKLMYNIV